MPHVLKMKDGSCEIPFSLEDALELVALYTGDELKDYLEEYLSETGAEKEYYQSENEDLRKELDEVLNHQHLTLCNLREELDGLLDLLTDERLNRRRITEGIRTIRNQINSEL